MADIGIRELRQNASDVIRRVESGEDVTVTVAGRAAARLVPIETRRWRSWEQVAEVFETPGAPDLAEEIRAWRRADSEGARDPFEPTER